MVALALSLATTSQAAPITGVVGTLAKLSAVESAGDQDGDGIPDSSDRCPALPGPAANQGCPPATSADQYLPYVPGKNPKHCKKHKRDRQHRAVKKCKKHKKHRHRAAPG
jgi:hypothetical protein